MVNELFFEDRESMQRALFVACSSALHSALSHHARISLLVSGGSSPEPLYRQLSQAALPWDRITVALVDERWVDQGHSKSNQAFIERTLLQDSAANAPFVAMKNAATTAVEGCGAANQAYEALPACWSLCLLGMGADGHTASLFPNAQGLEQGLAEHNAAVCVAIDAVPSEVTGDVTERLSLGLGGLMRAERLVLMITGEEKRRVYEQAKAGDDCFEMPVRAVLQQSQVPVDVYWAP